MVDANLLHTAGDLIFQSKDGRQMGIEELMDAIQELYLIKQFLEDSSLTEEWQEYKMVNKLKSK